MSLPGDAPRSPSSGPSQHSWPRDAAVVDSETLSLDNGLQSTVASPPPPMRYAYKVKKKRLAVSLELSGVCSDGDSVLPSIETADLPSDSFTDTNAPVATSYDLLAPSTAFQGFRLPTTPDPQENATYGQLDGGYHEWSYIRQNLGPGAGRSRSVCSSHSVSSSSDGGSSYSVPTSGASLSPDIDAANPLSSAHGDRKPLPPRDPHDQRITSSRDPDWTAEMDHHIESTYIKYMQDPTVTPFRLEATAVPPLGVCSQIATLTKNTWPRIKASQPSRLTIIPELDNEQHSDLSDTIRSATFAYRSKHEWPRSHAVRNRLRMLVRRNQSLKALQDRIFQDRGWSPMRPERLHQPSQSPTNAFSGGKMTTALIASTAPSMQPQGPLAQLATTDDNDVFGDERQPPRPQRQQSSRPDDWFARIGRSQAHQRSVSMQSLLNLETDTEQMELSSELSADSIMGPSAESSTDQSTEPATETNEQADTQLFSAPTTGTGAKSTTQIITQPIAQLAPLPIASPVGHLASPFDEAFQRSHLLNSMSQTRSLGRAHFQNGRPSLDPPFEGHPTLPRSLKRRFKSDEEKPRRIAVGDIFGVFEQDNVLGRNRGFSVGADRVLGRPRVSFSPVGEVVNVPPPPATRSLGVNTAARSLGDPIRRLGSPFPGIAENEVHSNDVASDNFPHGIVPTANNPHPFMDALFAVVARESNHQS